MRRPNMGVGWCVCVGWRGVCVCVMGEVRGEAREERETHT